MNPSKLDHVAYWVEDRDTVADFVTAHLGMHVIERTDRFTLLGSNARRGKITLFEADGPHGVRFTMTQAGTVLVLDDRRVIHETTAILPDGDAGARDTLVVTYRAGGFMEPA